MQHGGLQQIRSLFLSDDKGNTKVRSFGTNPKKLNLNLNLSQMGYCSFVDWLLKNVFKSTIDVVSQSKQIKTVGS